MASFTFASVADVFPVGATVGAYVPGGNVEHLVVGSAVATAVVQSTGSLTFTGLADDTAYVAYDGSRTKWFRTPDPAQAVAGVLPVETFRVGAGSDTATIVAALGAIGADGGAISFEQGRTYTTTGEIAVPSNVTIEGNGAIFKPNVASGTRWLTNSDRTNGNDRIKVRNLIFDGSLISTDQSASWVTFTKADDVQFLGCEFRHFPVSALSFDTCRRAVVDEACRFWDIGAARKVTSSVNIGCGVILQDSSDCQIDATFDDIWQIAVFISTLAGSSHDNKGNVTIRRCHDNGLRFQPSASLGWSTVHNNDFTVDADRVRIDSVRLNGFNNTVRVRARGVVDVGTVTSGSPTVTVTDTSVWTVGDPIQGTGIPSNTVVKSIDSGTTLTLGSGASLTVAAVNATASGSVDLYSTQSGVKSDGGTGHDCPLIDVKDVLQGVFYRLDANQFAGYNAATSDIHLGTIRIRGCLRPFSTARVQGTETFDGLTIESLIVDGATASNGPVEATNAFSGVSLVAVSQWRIDSFFVHGCSKAGIYLTACTSGGFGTGRSCDNMRAAFAGTYAGLVIDACDGVEVPPTVRCTDTRAGGSKTQSYGIRVINASTNVAWLAPNCAGNASADFNIDAGSTAGVAPRLERNASGYLTTPTGTQLDLTGKLTTRGSMVGVGASGGAVVMAGFVTGSAQNSFNDRADGSRTYGDGTGAADAQFGRLAADILGTSAGDKLVANGGLGVGNSAVATTPGAVVKRMEVFDAAGASLGFVPIYNSIT